MGSRDPHFAPTPRYENLPLWFNTQLGLPWLLRNPFPPQPQSWPSRDSAVPTQHPLSPRGSPKPPRRWCPPHCPLSRTPVQAGEAHSPPFPRIQGSQNPRSTSILPLPSAPGPRPLVGREGPGDLELATVTSPFRQRTTLTSVVCPEDAWSAGACPLGGDRGGGLRARDRRLRGHRKGQAPTPSQGHHLPDD